MKSSPDSANRAAAGGSPAITSSPSWGSPSARRAGTSFDCTIARPGDGGGEGGVGLLPEGLEARRRDLAHQHVAETVDGPARDAVPLGVEQAVAGGLRRQDGLAQGHGLGDARGEETAVRRLDAGPEHAHADLGAGAVEPEAEAVAAGVHDPDERRAGRAVEAADGAREDPGVALPDGFLPARLEVDDGLPAGGLANGPLPRRRPA